METNPKKQTAGEKNNSQKPEHVAAGSPVGSGVVNDNKHKDDSRKPKQQLDHEAAEEFEEHNMNDKDGYNEMPNDVPIENKNIADEPENTTN